jgi:hypothetical protein
MTKFDNCGVSIREKVWLENSLNQQKKGDGVGVDPVTEQVVKGNATRGEIGGHPKLTQTEVNIAAVADLVKNDCQIASRMIAESLNIPKIVVIWILKEHLGKRKLCARFVPCFLTPKQREDRVTSCQDIIATDDAHNNFFNKIIMGDETWRFSHDPKTKQKSSEWFGETSPQPKKLKFQRSRIKTMSIIFFLLSRRRIHTKGKKQ